jgi:UDP-N-acetylglucosamine 2-epimerase (non-hydrolysing)/GDP/UDP-N,N'-diacetylbacillosamine 2-epimerase (hydrolysing)
MRRTIAVVTTSRADYGHLHWVLRELQDHPRVDLRLIAVGAHLTGEFGRAVEEIERDGLRVHETIECLLSSDSDVGMAKTIGVATLGLADTLARVRPDLLLLIADRYELLAPASVALALRLPIAHIEGGEVSEGAIDDAVRNALTKMSHLHFVPTETARRRVLAMGEESWRVHRVGAPSIDHLRRSELDGREELEGALGMEIKDGSLLVAYHPVTIARDTLRETDALFDALERLDGQVLFSFPNADAGSRRLIARAETLCRSRPGWRLFVNLNPRRYWSLLREVGAMVGNSSSGIMETASIPLPTVNVGMRQQGRERAANVIDVPARSEAILEGIRRASDPGFREGLRGLVNPYGDGTASRRIAETLAGSPLGEELLLKRAVPVPPEADQEPARSTRPCEPPT